MSEKSCSSEPPPPPKKKVLFWWLDFPRQAGLLETTKYKADDSV